MSDYGVILFYTTSAVMRAEKMLKKENLTVKLVPTPRELSSDCGIALRFDWEHAERIETIMDAEHIEFDGIHRV
jgi:hypothetical protein